ncbi:MAG: hypothetical protein HGB35_05605 [Geobacteraceae bacterium]|nr:hypothetical protein [Geobacteraceae bacterium]
MFREHLFLPCFSFGFFAMMIGGCFGVFDNVTCCSKLMLRCRKVSRGIGLINVAMFFFIVVDSVTLIQLLSNSQWAVTAWIFWGSLIAAFLGIGSFYRFPLKLLMITSATPGCALSLTSHLKQQR